jgi:hypothetical protein
MYISQLRHFFEGDRTVCQLAEEEEFLHYYALPFVRAPATHPTFQALFQVCWGWRGEGGIVALVKKRDREVFVQ